MATTPPRLDAKTPPLRAPGTSTRVEAVAVIGDGSLGAHAPGLPSPLQDDHPPATSATKRVYAYTCLSQTNVLNFRRVDGCRVYSVVIVGKGNWGRKKVA